MKHIYKMQYGYQINQRKTSKDKDRQETKGKMKQVELPK